METHSGPRSAVRSAAQSAVQPVTQPASRTEPQVWNMFKRREEGEIWCAVPADTAVPSFLFSGEWDYGGQHPERRALPGFQRTIAHQAVRMNGFYLFHLLRVAT